MFLFRICLASVYRKGFLHDLIKSVLAILSARYLGLSMNVVQGLKKKKKIIYVSYIKTQWHNKRPILRVCHNISVGGDFKRTIVIALISK